MATILVIDDFASIRVFLEQTLVKAGHVVRVAANGRDGLALLRQERFDLLITDLYMPEADGLEVLAQAGPEGLLPRTIAISSPDMIMDLLPTARMMGAGATLQKPITAERLLSTVNDVLGHGPHDRASAGEGPRSATSTGATG